MKFDSPFAVIRRPQGLTALCHFFRSELWDDWYAMSQQQIESLYGYQCFDLTAKQLPAWPEYRRLWHSWKNLRHADLLNPDTLTDVLIVLIETCPYFEKPDPEPPILKIQNPQRQRKKTAANPRGLAREKRKKQPDTINLQPYLCDRKNIKKLLTHWAPYWPRAMKKLKQVGYDTSQLSQVNPGGLNALGVYLITHFPSAPPSCRIDFPDGFSQAILPVLKNRDWKEIPEYLKDYYDLELENDEELRGGISRLLYLAEKNEARHWVQVLTGLQPTHRKNICVNLIRSGLAKQIPGKASMISTTSLLNKIPQKKLKTYADTLVWGLRDALSHSYLEEGMRIAWKYDLYFRYYPVYDCPDYPADYFNKVYSYLHPGLEYSEVNLMDIWYECGTNPRFIELFRKINFMAHPPFTGRIFLDFFYNFLWEKIRDNRNISRYLENEIGNIENILISLPEAYQEEFLDNLREFITGLTQLQDFKRVMPVAYRFLERVCRPPWSKGNNATQAVYFLLLHLPAKKTEAFLNAEDSCFQKLEKACRSQNNRRLLRRGMEAMCRHSIEFTLDSFMKFPGTFCRVAKNLGTLPKHLRHQLVKQLLRHPLMKIDLPKISAKRLHHLIQNKCPENIKNPIPKKLRQHFEEGVELTPNRITGYSQKFKEKIPQLRLELLDHLVWERLQKPFGKAPKKDDWEHTFQMLYWMDDNRRSLKECIRSYLNGNWDYVEKHPETRRWLRKIPELDFEKWKQGLTQRQELAKQGTVHLEIEQNPLEILKMGTYVGSCLGLGGQYTFNAATVLLDINKQVLYARNSNKKVLGRQLIAISKNNQLVCFSVYPQKTPAPIKKMFLEYNREFSRKIGLPLLKPDKNSNEDVEYEIESILSQDWYDDNLWEKMGK